MAAKKLFIVTYHHKHGFDTWPVFADERPTDDEIIENLRREGSWDDDDDDRFDTYIDVTGPFELPGQSGRSGRSRRNKYLRSLNPYSEQKRVDAAFEEAGYYVEYTGGGCNVFIRREDKPKRQVVITSETRGFERPEAMDGEPIEVLEYDDWDEEVDDGHVPKEVTRYASVREFLDRHGFDIPEKKSSKRDQYTRSLNAFTRKLKRS